MSDKRLVHDVLSEASTTPGGHMMQRRPVAFIQHGNIEDGFTYEVICPFCAVTLCFIPHTLAATTIGGLYRLSLKHQKDHWYTTPHNTKEFAVEITRRSLNTQKPLEADDNERTH